MSEKTDSEKINDVYTALAGNQELGTKPVLERIFDEINSIKDTAKNLPCNNPEAPCPKPEKNGGTLIAFLKNLSFIERIVLLLILLLCGGGGLLF